MFQSIKGVQIIAKVTFGSTKMKMIQKYMSSKLLNQFVKLIFISLVMSISQAFSHLQNTRKIDQNIAIDHQEKTSLTHLNVWGYGHSICVSYFKCS
jgi:hypothetical protein